MTNRLELRQSKGRWCRPVIGPSVEPLLQARPAVQRKRRAMPVRIIALLLLIAHLSCGIAATLAMDTHGHDQNGGITTADSLALGHHCASPSDPD